MKTVMPSILMIFTRYFSLTPNIYTEIYNNLGQVSIAQKKTMSASGKQLSIWKIGCSMYPATTCWLSTSSSLCYVIRAGPFPSPRCNRHCTPNPSSLCQCCVTHCRRLLCRWLYMSHAMRKSHVRWFRWVARSSTRTPLYTSENDALVATPLSKNVPSFWITGDVTWAWLMSSATTSQNKRVHPVFKVPLRFLLLFLLWGCLWAVNLDVAMHFFGWHTWNKQY